MLARYVFLILVFNSTFARTQDHMFTLLADKEVDLPGPTMSYRQELVRGTFMFTFKTYSANAVVLYQDDHGFYNYIYLCLINGHLQLSFRVDTVEYTNTSTKRYDDFRWHTVAIQRRSGQTKLLLSPHEPDLVFERYTEKPGITFTSWLQLGGFAPQRYTSTTNLITKQGAFYFFLGNDVRKRRFFNACVSNVMFQPYDEDGKSGNIVYLKSIPAYQYYAKPGSCKLTECDKPDPVCQHGGQCFIKAGKTHCDCRWTGFDEENCSKPALELSLDGTYRVTYRWNLRRPAEMITASIKDVIIFRVKTKQTSAHILEIIGRENQDRLTITLIASRLRVKTHLGGRGAKASVTLITKDAISNGQWHTVNYTRIKNEHYLTIDKGKVKRATSNKYNLQLDFPEKPAAYIGAMQDPYKYDVVLQDLIWTKVPLHQKSRKKSSFEVNLLQGFYDSYKNGDPRFSISPRRTMPKINKKLPARPMIGTDASTPEMSDDPPTDCEGSEDESCRPDIKIDGSTVSPRKSARSSDDSDDSSLTWIVVVTVICCLILFAVIAFFVYRWNKRYSGDFQVNKKEIGPAGTVVHYKDAGYKEKERAMRL